MLYVTTQVIRYYRERTASRLPKIVISQSSKRKHNYRQRILHTIMRQRSVTVLPINSDVYFSI